MKQYFATAYFCDVMSGTQLAIGELCWDAETDQCIGYKAIEGTRLEATLQFFRALKGTGYGTNAEDIHTEMKSRASMPASYWIRKDQYPSINQLSAPQPALYPTNEEAISRLCRDW